MMIDKDEEYEDDEELSEEEREKIAKEKLLEIIVELGTTLEFIDYYDQLTGMDGEISEEEKKKIDEKLEERRRNFNPDNYYKNTETEDNFEKPDKDHVRVIYKGVNKPAVLWLLDKEGKEIVETIGGDYEKIPYEKDIYIYANKDREENNLDPNFVLHGEELIRGKVLFIKERKGKFKSMRPEKMLEIKDDMRATKVLYLEEGDERE